MKRTEVIFPISPRTLRGFFPAAAAFVIAAALLLAPFFNDCRAAGNSRAEISPPRAAALDGETWKRHYIEDILPYWSDKNALGEPCGNFPTRRDMNGAARGSIRYTRMIARQVYAYLIGFNLTGDEKLLEYAMCGARWMRMKAKDPGRGYHARLDAKGSPDRSYYKTAQDQAYSMLAFSALYYVTRHPSAKKELNENISLIFEGPFFDAGKRMIKDALSGDLSKTVPFENPGFDIVTVLDQANAYLGLFAACLEGAERRAVLKRLKICGDILAEKFFADGIFWDTDINRKNYNARHLDAGHVLKTYWMLYEIAGMWRREYGEPLYSKIIDEYMLKVLLAAYSEKYTMWGKKFKGSCVNVICAKPDWWMQCECNQLASRLIEKDARVARVLEKTAWFWLSSDFIDGTRAIRGVRDGVGLDGKFIKNRDSMTVKAYEWKNGYHESEQALTLYLALNSFNKKPSTLYFAVPRALAKKFVPTPYMFGGRAVSITEEGPAAGGEFVKIKAVFEHID